MTNFERFNLAISTALKPHGEIDLIQWVKKNVAINNSHKGSFMDFDLTPYFREPFIETITNPKLEEVVICAPVGSGKTSLLTAIGTTASALFPKQMMYVAQNEPMVTDFLELNLKPSLRKNKVIKRIWPSRNKDRRDGIHFATHSIFTGSAQSIGSLQSRSIDLLMADEIWLYEKDGIIEEMRRRLHNRPGSRCVLVSQGGVYGDQFEKTFSIGEIKKYAWECEECKNRNIYDFKDLKFEYEKNEDDKPIWSSINAELECPCCQKRYADKIHIRRKLSENAIYVTENPEQNFLPGHVSYNFNQLSMFDVAWKELATEFLKANASIQRAVEIRQFRQKKLAEFYDESKFLEQIDLSDNTESYAMDEFKDDPWEVRIITADVQQDRMFVAIRDWTKQGRSRLVAYKYCSTFADIERMRVEYGVRSKAVFIDAAYRSEEVKIACAQYGYIGLNGLKNILYRVKNRSGKTVERVFSAPVNYDIKTNIGTKRVQVINYAGTSVKDILNTIMAKKDMWQIPHTGENIDMYLHQLTSEVRDIDKSTGKPYYRKVRDQNHAFDTEVMQIVAAMIWNCLIFEEDEIADQD